MDDSSLEMVLCSCSLPFSLVFWFVLRRFIRFSLRFVAQSPGSVDPSSSGCELKSCEYCRTTTTPLWRAGPSGPKSLCNACGIRYRKNRRAPPAMKKEKRETTASSAAAGGVEKLNKVPLKLQVLGLGLWDQRSTIQKRQRWRRNMTGEEEQAAVLLMALSSGFL
ncbi:hypothetical protein ZIOFF_049239 [Zingiber officinale]|uniref:GATA-type domain-containing protein n=1 Tax=Zingiber officinale TaxID=94328 RepID=A0A8J5FWL2_ZINOF|nr:hypothetical protein ZIOFF_049239 [Zingiber officinale]